MSLFTAQLWRKILKKEPSRQGGAFDKMISNKSFGIKEKDKSIFPIFFWLEIVHCEINQFEWVSKKNREFTRRAG